MSPIDFRNENFDAIKARFTALRQVVYRAWVAHGPGTTRAVAAKAQMDILSFRPRTTELYQLGLVKLVEGRGTKDEGQTIDSRPSPLDGHQGVYCARTLGEWETWCQTEHERVTDCQMKLI